LITGNDERQPASQPELPFNDAVMHKHDSRPTAADFGDGETDSRHNRHGGLTVIEDGR
jgi:hypothetical protein